MKLELCHEIMACLPQGRTIFRYGKNHYAFYLLRRAAAGGTTVAKLRHSRLGPLLEKPLVRQWLASLGSGIIRPGDVPEYEWLPECETYRLSLGIWGEDTEDWKRNQVSREGASLVLHLNHSNWQHQRLQPLRQKVGRDPFTSYGHPEAGGNHPTLAWARLDIDLDQREALIEEIQSDRVQYVDWAVKRARRAKEKDDFYWYGSKMKPEIVLDYWEQEMKRHAAIWDEAILTAALHFLHLELGIRKVYYHTFESGSKLKHITGTKPPRSIYTDLPRRFCFAETEEIPRMFLECPSWQNRPRRQKREVKFQVLAI